MVPVYCLDEEHPISHALLIEGLLRAGSPKFIKQVLVQILLILDSTHGNYRILLLRASIREQINEFGDI